MVRGDAPHFPYRLSVLDCDSDILIVYRKLRFACWIAWESGSAHGNETCLGDWALDLERFRLSDIFWRCSHSMRWRASVRLSVRSSVPSIDSSNGGRGGYAAERPTGRRYRLIAAAALRAPCCRRAGAQQEMRVALRREPTEEAQHRLVYNFKSRTAFKPPSVIMAVVELLFMLFSHSRNRANHFCGW